MTRTDFYVYLYLREDKTPYYVGKGRGRRAYKHRKGEVRTPPHHRVVFMKENLTNEDAVALEALYIKFYGRKQFGGLLHNRTDGGEGFYGVVMTDEHKQRISQALTGKVRTKRHSQNISKALKGKPTWNKGKTYETGKPSWNKGKKWVMGANSREAVVRNSRSVTCDGVTYETAHDAAKVYNCHVTTIRNRCKNPQFPNFTM